MLHEIAIQVERENHGDWITVHIPYSTPESMFGALQNDRGETIKRLKLKEGNNSIDISNIKYNCIHIKIETPYETIFKKLNLNL